MKNSIDFNQAVITTKYVIHNDSPIIYVYRDEDGDWQFLGKEEVSEKDAMVVSLQQIIDLDASIKTILDLPKGDEASRNDKSSRWKTNS